MNDRAPPLKPTPEMIEAALRGWHDAIINAPTEDVEDRRRRCIGAALSAALSVQPAAAVVGEPVGECDHKGPLHYFSWGPCCKKCGEPYPFTAREETAAPSAPGGWQPMDTAPLDGKHSLLAVKEGAFIYTVQGAYQAGEWNAVHRGNVKPLCWMPNTRIPAEFLPWSEKP